MNHIEELRADIAELQNLKKEAKRQISKNVLDMQIQKSTSALEAALRKEAVAKETDEQKVAGTKPAGYWITVRTYSWDQSDKFMKLYVTIPGLTKADSEKVSCSFTAKGLELAVKDAESKHYQLIINNLAQNIVPDRSHCKAKDGMVVVFLCKESEGSKWSAVTAEEAKLKEKKDNKKPDKMSADPNDSMMGLMKQMYDDGDDDMKRMLNKAWYESQNKTGGGMPGMGMPGMDMPDMSGLGV